MKNIDAKIPTAEKQPTSLEKHGDVRIDNYFWMRLTDEQKLDNIKDDQTKKVINYLEEENTYHDRVTEFSKNFEETLFEEMKGRIKEDDSSRLLREFNVVPPSKSTAFYRCKILINPIIIYNGISLKIL